MGTPRRQALKGLVGFLVQGNIFSSWSAAETALPNALSIQPMMSMTRKSL